MLAKLFFAGRICMTIEYTSEQEAARSEAELRAAREVNHVGELISVGATDQYVCIGCGWKGNARYDGPRKARAEWVAHIREHGAEIDYPSLKDHTVAVGK